jgi:hypothetical protein
MAKKIVLMLFLIPLFGCSADGRMYNLATGEVSPFHYTYNGSGRGRINTAVKGESLNGEYSIVSNADVAWGSIYASVYSPNGYATGSATSTTVRTRGERRGSAILTGSNGTVLDCELLVGSNGHGTGGCKDNHDNKYRLMY